MSTETQNGTSSPNSQEAREGEVRTYRGKRLADLLPKIRQELGADAIILREREGLVGGINGFFAQRFVEVDARAGGPRIDIRDDDEEFDEPVSPAGSPAPEAATPTPFSLPADPGEVGGERGTEPNAGARETPTPFPQGPLRRELEIEAEKFERFLDVAAE